MYVVVGVLFRVVIIQDHIRDAACSESIFDVDWNAVWQVFHLYVSCGGCLGQWVQFPCRGAEHTSLVSSKRPCSLGEWL
jgi:hypothetical protein